ncbi:MAG: hypothetical protein O3A00_27420 [Planctomycetota bacterium]|nr:hypothetical protein [Planctomycetota bacterium]
MNRKKDLQTLIGGICLASFAYVDEEWRYFWVAAGFLMIAWSLATMLQPRTGR